jgi:hypothetical protein
MSSTIVSKRILIVLSFVAFDVLAFLVVFDRVQDAMRSGDSTHSAGEPNGQASGATLGASSARAVAPPSIVSSSARSAIMGAPDDSPAVDAMLIVRAVARSTRAPLAGVRIGLVSRDLSLAKTPVPVESSGAVLGESPITNVDGEARVGLPSGVEFELETSTARDDVGSATLVVSALVSGERRKLALELPFGDDLRVCGLVLDADGDRPIAGATVTAMMPETQAVATESQSGRTPSEIGTRDRSPAGSSSPPKLEPASGASGASPATPDSSSKSSATSSLRSSPTSSNPSALTSSSTSSLTNSSTSSPIGEPLRERTFASTKTDSSGHFELSVPSWRDNYAHVSAAGFGIGVSELGRDHETPVHPIVVRLHRSASIEARIVDEVGAPIPNVDVTAYVEAFRLQSEPAADSSLIGAPNLEWKARTDAQGKCTLSGLVAGTQLMVRFLRDGARVCADREIESLLPSEERSIQWDIDLGCTLAATLVDDDGAVVPDREVWLFASVIVDEKDGWQALSREELKDSKTTDANGRLAFHVNAGTWCIGPAPLRPTSVEPDSKAIVACGELFDVERGARRRDVTLHARRGTLIRGRVIDSSGGIPTRFNVRMLPLPPAEQYFARNQNETQGIYAHPEPNATFVLGPLPPGEFELTATGYDPNQPSLPAKMKVRSGDQNVVLQLRVLGHIFGRVVDARTRGPVAASVGLAPNSPSEYVCKADGRFSLRQRGYPGNWCLIATTPDGRIGLLKGVEDDIGQDLTGLEIGVELAGRLKIRYEGSREDFWISIDAADTPIAFTSVPRNGEVDQLVPAGKITINYPGPDKLYSSEKETTIAGGEQKSVVLRDER